MSVSVPPASKMASGRRQKMPAGLWPGARGAALVCELAVVTDWPSCGWMALHTMTSKVPSELRLSYLRLIHHSS